MIKEKLDTAIKGKNIGILVENENGIIYSFNETKKFRSASVIKLFILSYFTQYYKSFDEVVKIPAKARIDGSIITELEIEECSIYDLLLLMTASSCNTATNVLIDIVGFDTLEHYIYECGAFDTTLKRHMMDFEAAKNGYDNITTPVDVVKILKIIEINKMAMEILGQQKNVKRLMRYLYGSDFKFFGKSGELDDVFNDCGIINFRTGKSYCAVMTENMNRDEAAAICGITGLIAVGAESFVYPKHV